jgi:hypothetical protein
MCFLKEIQNNEILATSLAAYYSHGLKLVHKRKIEKCANEAKSEELEIKKGCPKTASIMLYCSILMGIFLFHLDDQVHGFIGSLDI